MFVGTNAFRWYFQHVCRKESHVNVGQFPLWLINSHGCWFFIPAFLGVWFKLFVGQIPVFGPRLGGKVLILIFLAAMKIPRLRCEGES
jgi:hypothetical protein